MLPVMTTPAPRRAKLDQRRSAERHDAIIQATLDLIEQGGYEAVSLRNIARAANVPLAATTYYFTSRDDIVRSAMDALIAREVQRLAELGDALGHETPMTLDEGIEMLVQIQREQLTAGRLTQITQFEFLLRQARTRDGNHDDTPWTAAYRAIAESILTRLGAASPQLDAQLVVATVNGLMIEGLTAGDDDFIDTDFRPTIRRLLHMLIQQSPDRRGVRSTPSGTSSARNGRHRQG